MDELRTEDEQLEALKRWWRENGVSTVLGVVVALALVFGWRGWQTHQIETAESASLVYDQLLLADSQDQFDRADQLAGKIRENWGGMTYANFAALFQAKYAVQASELDAAAAHLEWVLQNKPSKAIALQTRVRLAEVQLAQGKFDKALTTLEVNDEAGYAAAFAETRGDVFLAKNQQAEALAAYQRASEAAKLSERPAPNPILEMKIRELTPKGEETTQS